MNTRSVNSAAGVINAALTQNRTAAGIALALESAGLLMSPEAAADLASASVDAVAVAEKAVGELKWEHEESARLRARVAELETARTAVLDDFIARCEVALHGCCSECDAAIAIVKGRRQAALDGAPVPELSADGITRLFAPTQALREDPHDGPLAHKYLVPRDLPETGGGLRSCCAGPVCTCTVSSPQDDEYIPSQDESADADRIVAYRAPVSGNLYCAPCCDGRETFMRLTSEELPDGGLCVGCDVDVLIAAETGGVQ